MRYHKIYTLFDQPFRRKRMKVMAAYFQIKENTRVLDVGGTVYNWSFLSILPQLTIVNIEPKPKDFPSKFTYIQADARCLPFRDNEFDLVYSNSVIEHVGDFRSQERMAKEVQRVGKSYYVQTPNYWFPVEPHLLTPFFHWLPRGAQRRTIRYLTTWGILARPTPEQCRRFFKTTRLLTMSEVKRLFPDATFINEKYFGLVKSINAVHRSCVSSESSGHA